MARYITLLVAAVLAWVIDYASDFACDWWSPTCRDMSNTLSLFYYLVFIAIGWEVYRLYKERGPVVAGTASMALGQAALERTGELKRQISGKLTSTFSSTSLARSESEESVEDRENNAANSNAKASPSKRRGKKYD